MTWPAHVKATIASPSSKDHRRECANPEPGRCDNRRCPRGDVGPQTSSRLRAVRRHRRRSPGHGAPHFCGLSVPACSRRCHLAKLVRKESILGRSHLTRSRPRPKRKRRRAIRGRPDHRPIATCTCCMATESGCQSALPSGIARLIEPADLRIQTAALERPSQQQEGRAVSSVPLIVGHLQAGVLRPASRTELRGDTPALCVHRVDLAAGVIAEGSHECTVERFEMRVLPDRAAPRPLPA